jgi:beta-N-acetylhexosaminidase
MTDPTPVGRTAAIFGCAGPLLTPAEHALFRQADPLGFILFARNVESPDQLRRLTGDLRDSVGRDAPIFVDQEGGRVQRLRAPHWAEWLPPLNAVQLATERGGVDAARHMMYLRHRLIAAELHDVGIDANCAPCLDLATAVTHPFLLNRCYGSDPATVASLGRAAADGLLAGGVLPVMKHMPGHGHVAADTHHDLPTVAADLPTLMQGDFAPFRALADLPMAMTAHIVFSAISPKPATSAPAMIRLIRERLGFAGLIMSDDLNMQALRGSAAERTRRAIRAGCDIALFCKGTVRQMQAVADAAGPMDDAARKRARAALARRTPPDAVDIDALRTEHSSLLGG